MTEIEIQLEALKSAFNQLIAELNVVIGYNANVDIKNAYLNEYANLKSKQAEISRDSDWDN